MEQNHMLPKSREREREHESSTLEEPPPLNSAVTTTTTRTSTSTTPTRAHNCIKSPSLPPPPYLQSHDPAHLTFPDLPRDKLPPIKQQNATCNEPRLPSLSSLTGPQSLSQSQQFPCVPATLPHHPNQLLQSIPPNLGQVESSQDALGTQHGRGLPMVPPSKMDIDTGNNCAIGAASPDRPYDGRASSVLSGRASSVSLDDPDVRMAAEALGDLRADFVSSPPKQHTPLPGDSTSQTLVPSPFAMSQTQPEPLLSLLTTAHPLLATTIEGATSAYVNSKNYSPRFKSGAEYVEGYLTPIANTVGSVGRATGVEGGMRWFLGGRRPPLASDLEAADGGSSKRRKIDDGDLPIAQSVDVPSPQPGLVGGFHKPLDTLIFKPDRRLSVASSVSTLPAYDENRSPMYSEVEVHVRQQTSSETRLTRAVMSTSGLGAAMRSESLKSLKFCLGILRSANDHIGRIIGALKTTLEDYDRVDARQRASGDVPNEVSDDGEIVTDSHAKESDQPDRTQLAARVDKLRGDVLQTLLGVIDTVSRYAGGALPENARQLVRRHLMSLPARFRLISMLDTSQQQTTSSEQGDQADNSTLKDGAQKVIVLAMEGLDMMSQVSDVLDGTIVSAEEWLKRMGKKPEEGDECLPKIEPQPSPSEDVKMG